MVDFETFLTTLDGMLDAFGKAHLPADWHPGVRAALTRSEGLTLAIASQWQGLGSARGFYRAAQRQLRAAVPPLPDRSQCTRLLRQHADAVVACGRYLGPCLQAQPCVDEAVDGTAAPTREANRRGQGWLPGLADIGWSHRLGWDEGFHGWLSVNPLGALPGFGFGAASGKAQRRAATCFAVRQTPHPRLARVGAPALAVSVTARGVAAQERPQHWQDAYGAVVLGAPKRNSRHPWPRPWRRWLAGSRQIVEPVNSSLQQGFRLDRERPHPLEGFQVRLAAKRARPNFGLWLNPQLGRPLLAFMDLVAW